MTQEKNNPMVRKVEAEEILEILGRLKDIDKLQVLTAARVLDTANTMLKKA